MIIFRSAIRSDFARATAATARRTSRIDQHSALSTQHSALSTQHSALSTQHSALSTQHSALSTQHSALSTQHSALSTQHSALSTQHSALSTQCRDGVQSVETCGSLGAPYALGFWMALPTAEHVGSRNAATACCASRPAWKLRRGTQEMAKVAVLRVFFEHLSTGGSSG